MVMRKKPFFSIVIPTYNRASDLRFALFCILRQKFRDFEVVVSDNCSTDNTQEVVKQFHDKRIRYSKTEKTVWNSVNIGRGIGLARGKYVFMHSDDDFLLYETTLAAVYEEIIAHGCGFIRLNYLSMSFDRKHIFAYRLHKPFTKNTYLPKSLDNNSIVWFIRNSDPYFISGIIFRNDFPETVNIVDSDPAPWINILFYNAKKYGSVFIVKPHIIAQWSRRTTSITKAHHIFSLINGKLRSEEYLNNIKPKISNKEYRKFLQAELYHLYIEYFPMVKMKVGNIGLLQLAQRIRTIAPEVNRKISYWLYVILALIFPEIFWKLARELYFWLYAKSSRPYNYSKIRETLQQLERVFILSGYRQREKNSHVFNF